MCLERNFKLSAQIYVYQKSISALKQITCGQQELHKENEQLQLDTAAGILIESNLNMLPPEVWTRDCSDRGNLFLSFASSWPPVWHLALLVSPFSCVCICVCVSLKKCPIYLFGKSYIASFVRLRCLFKITIFSIILGIRKIHYWDNKMCHVNVSQEQMWKQFQEFQVSVFQSRGPDPLGGHQGVLLGLQKLEGKGRVNIND